MFCMCVCVCWGGWGWALLIIIPRWTYRKILSTNNQPLNYNGYDNKYSNPLNFNQSIISSSSLCQLFRWFRAFSVLMSLRTIRMRELNIEQKFGRWDNIKRNYYELYLITAYLDEEKIHLMWILNILSQLIEFERCEDRVTNWGNAPHHPYC